MLSEILDNFFFEREFYLYSSCPAVSNTSKRATSSSMTVCFRYESEVDNNVLAACLPDQVDMIC